jgi:hypothetical protein
MSDARTAGVPPALALERASLLLPRICRGCGCSDLRACPGGCSWVLLDFAIDAGVVRTEPSGICSMCADAMEWDMSLMATVDVGVEPRLVGVGGFS